MNWLNSIGFWWQDNKICPFKSFFKNALKINSMMQIFIINLIIIILYTTDCKFTFRSLSILIWKAQVPTHINFSCWNISHYWSKISCKCHFMLILRCFDQRYYVLEVWKKTKAWRTRLRLMCLGWHLISKPIKSVSPLRIKLFSAIFNTICSITVIPMIRDGRKSDRLRERHERRVAFVKVCSKGSSSEAV